MTDSNEMTCINPRALDVYQFPVVHQPGLASLWNRLRELVLSSMRAVRRSMAPTAVLKFLRGLHISDPLLSSLAWALMAAVPFFGAMIWLRSTTLAVSPWIKPIKFSLSLATYSATVVYFFRNLRLPRWQLVTARYAVAVSVSAEIIGLALQAWRTPIAMPMGRLDSLLSQTMTGMIMVDTTVVVWLLILFCGPRERIKLADHAMLAAVRFSIIIFLVGNAIGGYMLERGAHTVGTTDGGPGLPFLNWSTIAGDLRIAHFLAIHAIQVLPFLAYLVLQIPEISGRKRQWIVAGASTLFALFVAATFFQAAMGKPLLAFM